MAGTPQRNATLLQVQASEGADTWDGETAGAAKWAGAAGIYVQSRAVRRRSGNSAAVDVEWTLTLPQTLGLTVSVGDIVTFKPDGQPQLEGPVASVNAPQVPRGLAMPNFLRTQSVTLEPMGDAQPAD